jgi:hypothetical protein
VFKLTTNIIGFYQFNTNVRGNMCKEDMESKRCCGCSQGQQGVPGLQGLQGIQGVAGPQGAMGLTGAQGIQGLQGAPGKDCDGGGGGGDDCCNRYANIYSSVAQIIGAYSSANDTVTFNQQNAVSVGDFDLSLAASTGAITFLKHGIYNLAWLLQARITTPVPVPVPSWSFGFWLNGILIPGSIYSGYTQAPGDDAAHSTSEVMIEVKAGDVLKLRNTSVSPVNLNPSVTGSVFPITIASLNIKCMKALA